MPGITQGPSRENGQRPHEFGMARRHVLDFGFCSGWPLEGCREGEE